MNTRRRIKGDKKHSRSRLLYLDESYEGSPPEEKEKMYKKWTREENKEYAAYLAENIEEFSN